MMDEERKESIINTYREISSLLKKASEIKKHSPQKIIIKSIERINVPSGIIPTVQSIIITYHLNDIIRSDRLRKNIAYTFQEVYFLAFIYNSFNIWAGVQTLFLKLVLITYVSIFESIVLECANSICSSPSNCGKTKKCEYHFSGDERNKILMALKRMNALHVTNFSEEEMEEIKALINMRNNVHIRLVDYNELTEEKYTVELCNTANRYVGKLCRSLVSKVNQYYYCNKAT